jgi:putative transposase
LEDVAAFLWGTEGPNRTPVGGSGVRRSKTTCERLMRVCGAVGIPYWRRNWGCTRPGDGDFNDDLVNRAFDPEQPDKLWVSDVIEHPTSEGKTVEHSDHGSVYTSWLFGNRLRDAGLLGSMGAIGDCYDNSVAEAFFSILQRELLDQYHWQTRDQLATAIFDRIET